MCATRNLLHQRRRCAPRLIVGGFSDLGLHFGVIHDSYPIPIISDTAWLLMGKAIAVERTILNLANTGLEIVQGQVADLVFEAIEIHRIF